MTMQLRMPRSDIESESDFGNIPAAMAFDRQSLIDGLNHDLADRYQAILMYIHYGAKVTGPYCRELRALFQAGIGDIQRHAQFLADKVVALGGEPTTEYHAVPVADRARTMLERALELEARAITDCNVRILQAKGSRDTGLKVALENQIVEETRHREEIQRVLSGCFQFDFVSTGDDDLGDDDDDGNYPLI